VISAGLTPRTQGEQPGSGGHFQSFRVHSAATTDSYARAGRTIFPTARKSIYDVATVQVPVTLNGISRAVSSIEPIVVKTWLNWVIGTAPLHTVLVFPLTVWGTEKKYCDNGDEAMPAIVEQGVLAALPPMDGTDSPEVHPEVSEP